MADLKRPVQALLMSSSDDQWAAILSENKKITIREGRRDYVNGLVIIANTETGYCVKADITDVKHYLAREVPKKDFRDDGYSSGEQMIDDLKTFYPKINADSSVTVIRWNNVGGRMVDDYRAVSSS